MGYDVRGRHIEESLDDDTPGSSWQVTRVRGWKVSDLLTALELAQHNGLPVGCNAAPPAQHFTPGTGQGV